MAVIYQKVGGGLGKLLIGMLIGTIVGVGGVVGGVAVSAATLKTGQIISMAGGKPDNILTKEYQEKTVLDIVMDATGGKIKINTLADIAKITPAIDKYITNLSDQLNDLGCELTKEEIYSWPLEKLSDNLITSVKNVNIISFLSKGKTSDPDPVVKFLSYQTDDEGNYVTDAEGNLVPQKLNDMMDNPNYIQHKIDTMRIKTLFTDEQIYGNPEKGTTGSKLLQAIQNKTVKQLSQDGAFDDIKISDVVSGATASSKIVKAFERDGVTIGGMSAGVDNLYLDDVFNYSTSYDNLPMVLKKLLAKEAYGPVGGEKLEANPFTIHKMSFKEDGYPIEYDYIILSDGTWAEGVKEEDRTVRDLVNKTDYIRITNILKEEGVKVEKGFFDKETITVTKDIAEDGTVTWGYSFSDPVATPRDPNCETFDMRINKPEDWENIYVYPCNKPAKIKDLDESINNLTVKDVMKIKPGDALYKVRNESVKNGDDLFKAIKENLYISDIITNQNETKFLNKIPSDTPLEKIGSAVNSLKILTAFEDNIFLKPNPDAEAELSAKWKYMLIEDGEPWISPEHDSVNPTIVYPIKKSTDPFNTRLYVYDEATHTSNAGTWVNVDGTDYWVYKCNDYTVGGSGNKGIDQLINNMSANMKSATLNFLQEDGMVNVNYAFLNKPLDTRYTLAPALIAAGKDTYGKLTLKEFTDLINGGITVTP